MKKIVLILITIAYAFLVASCNQRSSSSGDTESIVYVNSDTLIAKYNFSVDQNKQFKATTDSFQTILQDREGALQSNYTSYQKSASTMTPAQRNQTESTLSQQQQEIQQMQQIFQQQLSQKQHDLGEQLSKKLQGFLKDYATQHHYKLIMLYHQIMNGESLLYGDNSLDITSDLLKDLNAAYAKDKK